MASGRLGHGGPPSRARSPRHHAPLAVTAAHPNVARVGASAADRGTDLPVRRSTATTRTAEDAAQQIGTQVERIVKSLVFVSSGEPIVVLCSGRSRADEMLLAAALGAPSLRRATADPAQAHTRYAIGGGSAFAHDRTCRRI